MFDGGAKPAEAAVPADANKVPTEDDLTKLLTSIKELLGKLMADPGLAQDQKDQLKGLNDQLGGIGANGVAEQPQADALDQAANQAKPNGNADELKLLEMLQEYLEALQKYREAKKAEAAAKA